MQDVLIILLFYVCAQCDAVTKENLRIEARGRSRAEDLGFLLLLSDWCRLIRWVICVARTHTYTHTHTNSEPHCNTLHRGVNYDWLNVTSLQ